MSNNKLITYTNYKPGDRVVVTLQPYEFPCPYCGAIPMSGSLEGQEIHGEIAFAIKEMRCSVCKKIFPVTEGFYGFYGDDGGTVSAPYTRLRPEIEE